MQINLPFALHEVVWTPSHGFNEKTVVCPECLGSRVVKMTLGNGESYELGCACCAKGYEGSLGVIKEFERKSVPEVFIPRRYGIDSDGVWYSESGPDSNAYTMRRATDMYATREECEVACLAFNAEYDKAQRGRELAHLESKKRSLAHSVHYWRAQRAKAVRDIELIDARMQQIESRKKAS